VQVAKWPSHNENCKFAEAPGFGTCLTIVRKGERTTMRAKGGDEEDDWMSAWGSTRDALVTAQKSMPGIPKEKGRGSRGMGNGGARGLPIPATRQARGALLINRGIVKKSQTWAAALVFGERQSSERPRLTSRKKSVSGKARSELERQVEQHGDKRVAEHPRRGAGSMKKTALWRRKLQSPQRVPARDQRAHGYVNSHCGTLRAAIETPGGENLGPLPLTKKVNIVREYVPITGRVINAREGRTKLKHWVLERASRLLERNSISCKELEKRLVFIKVEINQ